MRYRMTIAAIALAGALAGVRLGLAAVPLLQRMMQTRDRIAWEGVD
jgi:hypothetical protein